MRSFNMGLLIFFALPALSIATPTSDAKNAITAEIQRGNAALK